MERFLSKKLLVALLVLVFSAVALIMGKLSSQEFIGVALGIAGIYTTGNVTQKFVGHSKNPVPQKNQLNLPV